MYGRLSSQSVEFIKRGASNLSDSSYHSALVNYREELSHIISEVCRELNNMDDSPSWTSIIEGEEQDEELGHSINYKLKLSDYRNISLNICINTLRQSTISLHLNELSMNESFNKTIHHLPGIKRYYAIASNGNRLELKTQFSRKQLVSRYFLEYMVHLIQQLKPLIKTHKSHILRQAA